MDDPRRPWNDVERLARAGQIAEARQAMAQIDDDRLAQIADQLGVAGGYALARQAAYAAIEEEE